MKILFITNQLPYPPHSGGIIKSFHLVEFLSKESELSVVSLLKNDDVKQEDVFLDLFSFKDYYSKPVNIKRSSINLLKSLFLRKSLNLFRNYDKEAEQKIQELIPQQDIIFADHYEMFQYIPHNCKKKVVLHTHNAEFIMWKRYSELNSGFIKKFILNFESNRIRKAELEYCRRADLIFAAPNDQKEFVNSGAEQKKFKTTYHLGNDESLNMPPLNFDDTGENLLYVGTLTWEPNIDGLIWFIENIWESLKAQFPKLVFNIIGKNPDSRIVNAKSKHKDIVLHGFVEDLENFYKESRVFIVPQRFGSGIKVKILDSMYRGIPCVTTSIGVESLQITNEKELMVADDVSTFLKYTISLLSNKNLWNILNKNSRKSAREKYTWKDMLANHFKEMKEIISC